jgi:hypothetical protein
VPFQVFLALVISASLGAKPGGQPTHPSPVSVKPASSPQGFEFIDTSFENASPIWYDFEEDGTIDVHLLYDNERSSINRAAGHFHFAVIAKPGTHLTLEFRNLDNIWNQRWGSIAGELKTAVLSTNGREWAPIQLDSLPTNRVRLKVTMPGPRLFIARVEPYRLSDLDHLLARLRTNSLVGIDVIGRTVLGRPLEVIRIGNPAAKHRVFLRARAHPWEAGSSWVVQGFIERLLQSDPAAAACRELYCAYILPMANKDGVALGRTRFNLNGKDLNRNWDQTADRVLAPENYALEQWLQALVQSGRGPQLALELHNDGGGRLQLSRPEGPRLQPYLEHMTRLENLLRQNTWFREGSTQENFRNPGSLGEGWLERFGIYAAIHELNCNWIEGVKDYPSARHWQDYGAALTEVFRQYFTAED